MNLKTFLQKTYFCFQISRDKWSGLKLFYQTVKFSIFYRTPFLYPKLASSQRTTHYKLLIDGKRIDIKMRLQDILIFYEVFLSKTYQLPQTWTSEDGTIVDLGAHIGLTTIFLNLYYFPHHTFICVEPSKKNLALLRYNLKNIPCHILEGAISNDTNGVFLNDAAIGYNHQITTQTEGALVASYSIASILKKFQLNKIHLLKIDIEGAERLIFQQAHAWLPSVDYFIIELHEGYGIEQLKNDVSPFGFEVIEPGDRGDILMIGGARNTTLKLNV